MRRLMLSTLVLLALSLAACRPTTSPTIVKTGVSVTPGGPTATPECLVWVPQRGGTMKCALTATPGPSRTPRPVPCGQIVVCKCVSPILVEAWVDRNANGNRDPEDTPLQGVRFRLQWIEEGKTCDTPIRIKLSLLPHGRGVDSCSVPYAAYSCDTPGPDRWPGGSTCQQGRREIGRVPPGQERTWRQSERP